MKITCMPIVLFYILSLCLKCLSVRCVVTAYECTFPSEQCFKSDTLAAKKVVSYILLKKVLLKLNFEHKRDLHAKFFFYILPFCLKFVLFQFFSRSICMHNPILTEVQNGRRF